MSRIEVPYLVIGAGPVGMIEGILLAQQGRNCLVVERRSGPQRAPAGRATSTRRLRA
jgi:2-polyprenyl-6-methoxyphenol hydroxylase-like FAD-dependent oxidoreductase